MTSSSPSSGSPWLYVALAISGWATAATAFKLGLRYLDAAQLLAWASLSSTGILAVVLVAQKQVSQLQQQSWTQIRWSALQGGLNPFGYYLILFQAYDRLPAQAAMALNYTWPLTLAVLAVPLLKDPLRPRTLGAIGVSLVGILLIATQGDLTTLQIEDPWGVALALGSSGVWATYWLTTVRDPRPGVVKLFMGFSFGTLYTWLTLPVFSTWMWPDSVGLLLGGYIGLAEMGLAFVCWLKALEVTPDRGAVANTVYLSPFLSLLVIGLVLREPIAPASVAGLILIVGGIVWQSRPPPPKKL